MPSSWRRLPLSITFRWEYAVTSDTVLKKHMQRKCDLRQLGGLLDSKGYAIAMPKNSPYSATISQGVIRLIEKVSH